MKTWQNVAAWGCGSCLVLSVIGIVVGVFAVRGLGRMFMESLEDLDEVSWTACAVPQSDEAVELTFLQKSIHPFLAEYAYKIRFEGEEGTVERLLPINVGGRTRMNAYGYPDDPTLGPAIRLQDHWGEYLIGLREKKTYRLIRYQDRVFAGEIAEGGAGYSMSQSKSAEGKTVYRVTVNGRPAVDVTDTAVGKGPGRYFGRIDGREHPLRFIPVSESPEVKIDMI